jgi:hypothetical protein
VRRRFLAVALAVIPGSSWAAPAVSLGADVIHQPGAPYLEVRDQRTHYSIYAALLSSQPRVGADLRVFSLGGLSFHAGAELATPNEIVGTPLRYELRFAYNLGPHTVVQWVHESNCKKLCKQVPGMSVLPHGTGSRANSGENFLTLGWRW